ncbi:hypothetical protein FGE12_20880 [Aggregicoccus sp. 17bor-14]|uniref:hypothetical protein n=1 Tax=Myxococcaceae TaxID=31 RepID=UPI00129C23A6|nr:MULTISPECIES: hypothetical protein [Myxococcaceae]MBF5044867.1 hypothetical protein [Simulacricoccus sp. 17bor-14]MRI90611.1 hypothetical protein [Aggregicoccus sp. 17bor-14]
MSPLRPALLLAALLALPAAAQSRPDEDALFGGPSAPDAGTPLAAQPQAPAQAPASPADAGTPERPSEDSLFGGGQEPEAKPTPAPNAKPDQPPNVDESGREKRRDEEALSGPTGPNTFETEETADDPLKLGGFFYLRAEMRGVEGASFGETPIAAPTLVDGYFDARPTDRIRGFVAPRLTFDSTNARTTASSGVITTAGAPTTAQAQVALDQAWLRFDIARKVFLTLGKQHVKWGTGRFWNPTDFLTPQRLDPLAVFDARTGASMVKLHVPWEAKGWNFYAIGLLDNAGPASTVNQVGGALRAEIVLGPAELGVSGVLQRTRRPRLGLDVSSAVGPFDVYGELALKTRSDADVYNVPEGTTLQDVLEDPALVDGHRPHGLTPQGTVGASYDFAYTDTDQATVGVEYFYNATGYPSEDVYPLLIFKNQFTPFYLGRHYAGIYLVLLAPGKLEDSTFTLSTLGNLSDRSYISRLDMTQRVLRYLSVNAFAAYSYGTRGGEFRFALDPDTIPLNPADLSKGFVPPIPAPTVQVGMGLRISI